MHNQLKNLTSWYWLVAGAGLLVVGLAIALAPEMSSEPASMKARPTAPASVVMEVESMYCSGCVRTVRENLTALGGVDRAEVRLEKSQAEVWTAGGASVSDRTLRKTIEEAGYATGAIKRRPPDRND